jgi:hypothetical protein
MKKIIFIAFLVQCTMGYAQKLMEIRPALGMTFGDLNPNPTGVKSNAQVGFNLGGDIILGKQFYLCPGIFYSSMASELEPLGGGSTFDVKFHRIKIPAYLGIRLISPEIESMANVRIFAGPSGSWVTDITSDQSSINKDDFNKFIWSGNGGIGVDLLFLFADAGYEFGLTEVFKDTNALGKSKNNGFWINAGLRIKI